MIYKLHNLFNIADVEESSSKDTYNRIHLIVNVIIIIFNVSWEL